MIRKLIGITLLILGLSLKITLSHNIDFWVISKNVSIILFAIGLILLTPTRILSTSNFSLKKTSNSKMIISKVLNLIVIALIFGCLLGLEKLGNYLNYNTRNFFLSQNTEMTSGTITGIERINILKVGYADFYLVDFKLNGEIYSSGLLVDYAEKDNANINRYSKSEISGKSMINYKLKGKNVKITYSKRFPSFLRIEE
jgi:hypothetical protein